MRILLKNTTDDGFKEVIVKNELEALQNLGGGYIETVTLTTDCVGVCNEEGRMKGLPANCNYLGVDFVGPILLAGVDGEDFTDYPWSVTMANKGIAEAGR